MLIEHFLMNCEVFENRLCGEFLLYMYLFSQKKTRKLRNKVVTGAKVCRKECSIHSDIWWKARIAFWLIVAKKALEFLISGCYSVFINFINSVTLRKFPSSWIICSPYIVMPLCCIYRASLAKKPGRRWARW